jgi:3-oxoacyl-[acyl-carrier-protein] synthase II
MHVAITGIGMITPLGINANECWNNLVLGKSGIRRITRFNTDGLITQIGGEIPAEYFQAEKHLFSSDAIKQMIFPVRLSVYAVNLAIEDSGISRKEIQNTLTGVITGSGGSVYNDDVMFMSEDADRLSAPNLEMLDSHATAISREFGFTGPSLNVATACSSGAYAVGLGYDCVVQTGFPCIAVGVDTMVLKEKLNGFNQILAISENNAHPEKASRPFDKKRNGFVVSEGACALLLEPYEHAMKRHSRIYAVVSGYAATSEAYNIIAPEPEGIQMARTMENALEYAGVSPEKVGYINAHGTSTLYNDLAETRAIKRVFQKKAPFIPISSQKSMLGHSIGGAGTIEAGVTALSIYHQVITPTINLDYPDPNCDLDYVPNKARKVNSLRTAISNSFGFGGHNCTLVLQHPEMCNPNIQGI